MFGRSQPPLLSCVAERIALLKPSALGDIIHSLPVLTALRQRFPHAHITWVVNQTYEPLLRGHRDLNDTLPFARRRSHRGWRASAHSWLTFLGQLRRRRFDLVIDLQGLFRTAVMAAATGAKRRVGLSTAREGATWSYTDVIPVADFTALHAVDRCWLVAEAFGVGEVSRQFHVPIAAEARAWADERTKGCPRPWLMLAPGSRWPTKRWPPEHFAALASRAQADFGGTVFFVGGGDESPLASAVRSRLHGPAHDLTGRTTLPQLAALLERADVMLANNSGPLHLAAALGRPVVAPYTCTKVRLNGPYGPSQERVASGEWRVAREESPSSLATRHSPLATPQAVESTVWCQGSYVKRCARMECMAELTPDRLWPPLFEVLRSWPSRSQSA